MATQLPLVIFTVHHLSACALPMEYSTVIMCSLTWVFPLLLKYTFQVNLHSTTVMQMKGNGIEHT